MASIPSETLPSDCVSIKRSKSKKSPSSYFSNLSKSTDVSLKSQKDKKGKSTDKKKKKSKTLPRTELPLNSIVPYLVEASSFSTEPTLVSETSSKGVEDCQEIYSDQAIDLIFVPNLNVEVENVPTITIATIAATKAKASDSDKEILFCGMCAKLDLVCDEISRQRFLEGKAEEEGLEMQREILKRLTSLERSLDDFRRERSIRDSEMVKTIDKLDLQISDMEARDVKERTLKSHNKRQDKTTTERDSAQLRLFFSEIREKLTKSDETMLEFVNATNASVLKCSTALPHFIKLVQLGEVHTRALTLLLGEKGYETVREKDKEEERRREGGEGFCTTKQRK